MANWPKRQSRESILGTNAGNDIGYSYLLDGDPRTPMGASSIVPTLAPSNESATPESW